jgi:hypothetical protein
MIIGLVLIVAIGAALESESEPKRENKNGPNATFKQIPDVNLNTARIDTEAD